MLKKYILLTGLVVPLLCSGQRNGKELSLAFTNNHSAYPFASFSKLYGGPLHPGVEFGYSFNWKTMKKHDWWQSLKAGLFHHRFVQTAIPLYAQVGYRYKPLNQLHLQAGIGAGYLHSIPATAVLQQNDDGEYEKAKGIGRAQALFNLSMGVRFRFKGERSPALFLHYVQQLQTPFIKSYVPLLPYNSTAIGLSVPLKK